MFVSADEIALNGQRAYLKGVKRENNPYLPMREKGFAKAWDAGYCEAHAFKTGEWLPLSLGLKG